MKHGEEVSAVVHPDYYLENDKKIVEELKLNTQRLIKIDIKLHSLEKVEDLYKDRTTFYKTL